MRLYGVARSIALCEADNEVQRIREELELLPREMTAHLRYLQQLLAKQGDVEAALLAAQRLPADQCDAAASSLVAAGYGQLAGQGRYQPSAVQLVADSQALSGALSYLRIAKVEVQRLLANSRQQMRSLNVEGLPGVVVEQESEDVDSEGSGFAPDSDVEGGEGAV